MPKAPKRAGDRIRKQRFCPDELQAMVDYLAEHADVVFSSDMRKESTLRKKAIWAELAQRVSAVGNTPRTLRDCRKWWDDLRVRGLLSSNRSQALQTEVGQVPQYNSSCGRRPVWSSLALNRLRAWGPWSAGERLLQKEAQTMTAQSPKEAAQAPLRVLAGSGRSQQERKTSPSLRKGHWKLADQQPTQPRRQQL
ncbi:myb-related transcription factor, partner of profilin-like [Ambystoma mexicanum]|uniref:myb-related transcription factor, partner of profilin-like n=1 Tax=Ambystoma mexicanum TaxID=8296 RepID=UPI0037E88A36